MTPRRIHPKWTPLWSVAAGCFVSTFVGLPIAEAHGFSPGPHPVVVALGAISFMVVLTTRPLDMRAAGAPATPPAKTGWRAAEEILSRMAGHGPLPVANRDGPHDAWQCTTCHVVGPTQEALVHESSCAWVGARTLRWLYGGRLP